jgi:hypothetical protein
MSNPVLAQREYETSEWLVYDEGFGDDAEVIVADEVAMDVADEPQLAFTLRPWPADVGRKLRAALEYAVQHGRLGVAEAEAVLLSFKAHPLDEGPVSRELWARFNLLADQLEDDTAALSTMRKVARHPAFRDLQTLPANDVIPLCIDRLKRGHRPLWVWVLRQIADNDPSADAASLADATTAWLAWERQLRGLGGRTRADR